jgi:hypothetical protein
VKPTVFIQANERQQLGAKISAHSFRRNARDPDSFDVRILHTRDFPRLGHSTQTYLRAGEVTQWDPDDLQSFTPLRFYPPQAMGFEGVAVVTDPDVFAVGDVGELLTRDMDGKAIWAVWRPGRDRRPDYVATSVMLLDCAKLTHWNVRRGFDELFEKKRDYHEWISLLLEPRDTIGSFEDEWNDFDRLTPQTKMLHNTRRRTQPWKTGLPVDYTPTEYVPVIGWIMQMRRKMFGDHGLLGRYSRHPDRRQEEFFFTLLQECLAKGLIKESAIREAMNRNFIRHDALDVVARVPRLQFT